MKTMLRKTIYLLVAIMVVSLSAVPVFAEPQPMHGANNPFSIKIEQVLTAPADMEDATFTYVLTPEDPKAPMPEGSTEDGYEFSITGNGSRYIGLFDYKKQGVFKYELRKVTESERPGFVHQRRKYDIEVYVDKELAAGVVALNEDGSKAEYIIFASSYEIMSEEADPIAPAYPKPPSVSDKPKNQQVIRPDSPAKPAVSSFKTGDDSNPALYRAMLAVSGATIPLLLFLLRKRR